jgi:hypothetical protein
MTVPVQNTTTGLVFPSMQLCQVTKNHCKGGKKEDDE